MFSLVLSGSAEIDFGPLSHVIAVSHQQTFCWFTDKHAFSPPLLIAFTLAMLYVCSWFHLSLCFMLLLILRYFHFNFDTFFFCLFSVFSGVILRCTWETYPIFYIIIIILSRMMLGIHWYQWPMLEIYFRVHVS